MQRVTEIYEKMPKVSVGKMTIGEGIQTGHTWIENEEGEGGDFPTEDIEKHF